jgi:hypothetical protein
MINRHNIPTTVVTSEDFSELLICDGVSYPILIETMIRLSFVIEEKIAEEAKGKKGTIMFDGWSKFSTHYVALIATYLKGTGEIISSMRKKWKQ